MELGVLFLFNDDDNDDDDDDGNPEIVTKSNQMTSLLLVMHSKWIEMCGVWQRIRAHRIILTVIVFSVCGWQFTVRSPVEYSVGLVFNWVQKGEYEQMNEFYSSRAFHLPNRIVIGLANTICFFSSSNRCSDAFDWGVCVMHSFTSLSCNIFFFFFVTKLNFHYSDGWKLNKYYFARASSQFTIRFVASLIYSAIIISIYSKFWMFGVPATENKTKNSL